MSDNTAQTAEAAVAAQPNKPSAPDPKGDWTQIFHWNQYKPEVSNGLMFFSPSLILILFTLISQIAQQSNHFSLLMLVIVGFHGFLKFTNNPISNKLQYRLLYKSLLCFFILYYSPTLQYQQAKIMLAVLFPLYYHILTASIPITLLLSFPILLFLFCSSLEETFSNPTLIVFFIVIPTIFGVRSSATPPTVIRQKSAPGSALKKKAVEIREDRPVNDTQIDESIVLPDMEDHLIKKPSSDYSADEHERVILGISHDCRNLLNSLKVIMTFMKDRNNEDEDEPKYDDDNLQSAVAITEHLALLLTNLLDYLKKNEDVNHEEETKLTSTLEKIWLMIAPNLKRKNLGGSITIKNGTPLRVQLDERKFMGILLNLVGNSTKFTDSGHIKINVSWSDAVPSGQRDARANLPLMGESMRRAEFSRRTFSEVTENNFESGKTESISFNKKCFTTMSRNESDGDQLEKEGKLILTVRDTGCGMDENGIKKLFKKYIQIGGDPEKSKLGYGLGLWYTKYLLNKLHGTIDFRSSIDVGTWAKVEIPCKIVRGKHLNTFELINQQRNSNIPMCLEQIAAKPFVFIRDNDKMLGLWMSEYLKKKFPNSVEVVKIDKISDMLNYNSEACMNIIGENSLTAEDMQALKQINLNEKKDKLNVILLQDVGGYSQENSDFWREFNVSTVLYKPLRLSHLDHLVKLIETTFNKMQASEQMQRSDVPHVLVVDDESTSLFFVEKFLAKNKVLCQTARNGLEAVEIYQRDQMNIKLILMDSEMPKMNGIEATKAIRKISTNNELKIIGMTGDDTETFKKIAMDSGMDGVIVKPVPWDQLLGIIGAAL